MPAVHVPSQEVTYHGSVSGSVEHFQGIRYAKDTSGERRFAPPEPYLPEKNATIDASRAGSVCPQLEAAMPLAFDETLEMSEDCLNLRIARPAGVSQDDELPVLIWIHGGGVVKGSAYDSHFNPDKFLELSIADGTPVIFAAINYRLSIFGFPRLPSLKDQKSLNLGVRDQRLALEWIKDNIRAFGGDPERITVYGLSAGGTFAGLHTLAYGGQHGVPFQQAWMMSGPPGTALNMSGDATTGHTLNVADRLNCGGSVDNDLEILKCLRAVPMKDLLDTAISYSQENHPPMGLFTFIPSVDGDFFPDTQSHLIRDGRFVKGIKMILGWTSDDGALNVGDARAIQTEDDMIGPIESFASGLSETHLSEIFALYPATAFQQDLENYESRKAPTDPTISIHFLRVSRILRDILFTCPSIEYGYQMYRQTREKQPKFDSVKLYDLNQSVFTPMMAGAGMPYLGTTHGSDTPYIFNGFPEGEFSEPDHQLALKMSRSLISFAHSGDPVTFPIAMGHFPGWPLAYHFTNVNETIPSTFHMPVIGGPHGAITVMVKDERLGYESDEPGFLETYLDFFMSGPPLNWYVEPLIRKEDLFRRCTYLCSLNEVLGR